MKISPVLKFSTCSILSNARSWLVFRSCNRSISWKHIVGGLIILGFSLPAFSQVLLPVAKTPDPAPFWTAKVDLGLYSLAWSPDSQFLAIGGRGLIRIYRLPDLTVERSFDTGQQEIWGLEWSPNGQFLACAGKDGTVQLWQGDKMQKKLIHDGWVTDLAWNPNGTSLIAVDFTGLAKEWDVEGFLRTSIQLDADGLGVDWSPKGRLFAVATGHEASRLLLFDSKSGELKWRRQNVPKAYKAPFGYGLDEVNGVRYSPNGKWIATAHQDGRVIVHSAVTGEAVFTSQVHNPGVGGSRRLAWSPNGAWLVSSGEDGRVNAVRYPNGKERLDLLDVDKPVWSVGWSPDNRWIAAVGEEGRVWVWATSAVPLRPSKLTARNNNKPVESIRTQSEPTPEHRVQKEPTLLDWFRRHLHDASTH